VLASILGSAGCSEEPPPAPVTEPEPEPAAPVVVEPPAVGAIPAPSAGRAQVAIPTLGEGFSFPVSELEAGFGRDTTMTLLKLQTEGGPSIQLTFHGARPSTGDHPVATDPAEDTWTGALGGTHLELRGGTLTVDALEDQQLTGSFDLEVREPRAPEPTRLRGRFSARRDRYYDGVIEHQAAIRDQLRNRN